MSADLCNLSLSLVSSAKERTVKRHRLVLDQDSQIWMEECIDSSAQTRVRPMGGFHCHDPIKQLAIIYGF